LNQNKKIVIIGCGAAGGTAAQFARKTDRKSSITILEKGKYPQYSKCSLPYILSGTISKVSNLIEFSEEWFKKANIDLLLETTLEKIDIDTRIVFAKKGNTIIEKSFDSVIICTGAKPFFPPIKNLEEDGKLVDGVYAVRTIDDIEKISSFLKKGGNATIVGAGLIGLEMADNLHKKGMNITVVEMLPQILANTLDEEMSKIVFDEISKNIEILINHIATRIESKNGKISKVLVKNNETGKEKDINTDLLIIATGCKPDVLLAKNIGCKIGKTGGIIVNERSETSIKNVYAVGDCTEYLDFITKKPIPIGLGSIAVRQGITAGINASGGDYILPKGVLQTRTSKFFDLEIAAVGPAIDLLKDISIVSAKFNGYSLPEYFPGGKPVIIKITVDQNTGLILSAQAVGENAAQRINTIACAILGGIDIETFRKLETAYAPSIAPTLDAVTLVCDIISMKLNRKR
jgi:NADH oxidase (H2O2-forming)